LVLLPFFTHFNAYFKHLGIEIHEHLENLIPTGGRRLARLALIASLQELFGTSATADEKDIKKSLGKNFESHFISVKKTSMIFHDGLINWATVGDVIKNHKL
jgi:hypothetical protein